MDVDIDAVTDADIKTLTDFTAKFPEYFGNQRPYKLIYCTPYHKISNSQYTGPRTISQRTQQTPIGKYYDPALALRESEIRDNLLKTKLKLEHDGQVLEGRFLSYKIVAGRVHALCLLHTDTPEKQAIANDIGPDRPFNGLSVSASWPTNANGTVVMGPAKLDHVAFTKNPFYQTYIHMAASRQTADRELSDLLSARLVKFMDATLKSTTTTQGPPAPSTTPTQPAPAATTNSAALQKPPLDEDLLRILRDQGITKEKLLAIVDAADQNAANLKTISATLAEKDKLLKQMTEEKKLHMRESLKEAAQRLQMPITDADFMDIDELAESGKSGYQKLVKLMTSLGKKANEVTQTPALPAHTAPVPPTVAATQEAAADAHSQLFDNKRNKRPRDAMDEDGDELTRAGKQAKTLKMEASLEHANSSSSSSTSMFAPPVAPASIKMEASDAEIMKKNMDITLKILRQSLARAANTSKSADELFGGASWNQKM